MGVLLWDSAFQTDSSSRPKYVTPRKTIDSQVLMQEVVLDEIVDRISRLLYRNNLIIKDGFLVASMIGIDTRSGRESHPAINMCW